MKIPQDARFRSERSLYVLRFCCEVCAAFGPAHADCAYGYPVDEHRLARYRDPDAEIVFCKDFEAA